jgi:ElaB/YqjD/DUF883 family membrane-anchored ribosome-binding protein
MKTIKKAIPLAVAAALTGFSGGATPAGFALSEQNASGLGNAYAGQAAAAVSEELAHQRENVAESLGRVASAMHENADCVTGGTRAADLTHSVAKGIDSTASYLRDHNFKQMGKDVTNICRRYPTQSVIAAVAVGFLLGRAARRR